MFSIEFGSRELKWTDRDWIQKGLTVFSETERNGTEYAEISRGDTPTNFFFHKTK